MKYRVDYEELVKQNVGLREEIRQLRNDSVNNFRGIHEIYQDTHRNSLKLTGIPESPAKRDPMTQRMIPEKTRGSHSEVSGSQDEHFYRGDRIGLC